VTVSSGADIGQWLSITSSFIRLTQAGNFASVLSIPIATAEAEPPMILHLVPMRGEAHDLFSDSRGHADDPQQVPTAEVIQGHFDLTRVKQRSRGQVPISRQLKELPTPSVSRRRPYVHDSNPF
jgi:hypothetical protein